jgi:hypothetical protein
VLQERLRTGGVAMWSGGGEVSRVLPAEYSG